MTIATETTSVGAASASPSRRVRLLDMPFDALSFSEALAALMALAGTDGPAYAVTANVDHVVRYHKRPDVRAIYDEADLVLADGMPLVWASRWVGARLPERVAGSDLFPAMCARAAEAGRSVFLLGGAPGAAERCRAILQERHPDLAIAGAFCPPYGFEHDPGEAQRAAEVVRSAGADIVFVGLGSPKQERWIVDNRRRCGAKLYIGIGISFSFLAGEVRRAPRWLQRLGLEWAHRMCQEPGRLCKRYLVDDAAFIPILLRDWLRRKRTSTVTR